MTIQPKRTQLNRRKTLAVAAGVVERMEGRILFSTIAVVEGQASSTAATLDQNPVITTVLSQPGTVTARGGTTKSVTQYNFLVNDGTGSAEIFGYKPTSGQYLPAVGDTINVTGTYAPFSGVPEISTITTISKTGAVAVPGPTVTTIPAIGSGATLPQTIEGYPVTLQNVLISGITGTTFTSSSQTGKLTDGSGNSVAFFTSTSNGAAFSDLVGAPIPSSTTPVNVTGIIQIFNNAPEFVPISVGAPVVTSVSPTAGPTIGGNTVTVNGYGFTNTTGVSFGSAAATNVTLVSDQQLTVTAPGGSVGAADVVVSNGNGPSATSSADLYTYTTAPVVSGVSPSAGPVAGGTSVTITGTGFTGATAVKFGAAPATSFTVNSPTQITATDPAATGTGTVDVTVTTPGGGTSATGAAGRFTYAGVPTVTSLSPSSGADSGGTTVTITGTSFISGTAVSFGGTAATNVQIISPTQVTAVAPAGALGSVVDVTVTTPLGSSSASQADRYTYSATTDAAAAGLTSGTPVTLDNGPVVTAILTTPGSTNGVSYTNGAYLVNDGTESIDVFGPNAGGYTPTIGDKVSIQGTWSPFNGIPEVGSVTSVQVISQGNPAPVPTPVTTTIPHVNVTTLPADVAGQLVTLNNVTISGISGTFGTSNLTGTITDSNGASMTLYYYPSTYSTANAFFNGLAIPTTPVNLTGIVQVFSGTTAEFIPISEPGTFDKFSMTNNATPTGEADGFSAVQRGNSVTVTVTRTEGIDNGSVGYSLTPDSAVAGTDYTGPAGSTTTAGVITGTISFPAGVTTQTVTLNTASNPGDSGDKLFTVTLTNPTTDQAGAILPAVTGGPATLVIQDPNSSHTLSNNSFKEEGVIQPAGPRATTATNINVEANNATNGANTSFAVLTYDDQNADPSHVFSLPATPVGTIQGVELETVAAPASFNVSGPLNVYLVSNTLTSSGGVYPDGSLKFDTTNDPTGGVGTQLGTKYLLGTIQYSANQAAGGYTPYNLTNLDPTGLAMLKSALNNGSAFTIAVTPGNSTATASWAGSTTSGVLQSPVLRFDYSTSTAPALPAWLAQNSVASYNASTHALTVTGAATIIADPGSDEPVITANGPLAQLKVQPATGDVDVHVGGITLTGGAGLTMASVGPSRSHSDHNVLGTPGASSSPAFSVDSGSRLDLGDNDLVVHSGTSDASGQNELAAVQGLAATGRGVKAGGIYDGTWAGNGLGSSAAAAADGSAGYEQNVLAVALNSDLFLGTLTRWSVGSASEQLAANDVLVKYTYNGDVALEGAVNGDASTVFSTFYDGGASKQNDLAFGDLNGDGKVDGNDATIFSTVFGNGTAGSGLPLL